MILVIHYIFNFKIQCNSGLPAEPPSHTFILIVIDYSQAPFSFVTDIAPMP